MKSKMFEEMVIFSLTFLIVYSIFLAFERIKFFKSFENRNIPGPKPNIFFGNLFELRKYKNRNDLLEIWSKKYGKVFGFFIGVRRFISISNLDLVQKVLITEHKYFYNRDDFVLDLNYLKDSLIALKDEKWHDLRKKISPTFSHNKVISGKFDVDINNCISSLNDEIKRKIDEENKNDMDIYDLSQSFTLDVISRTAFGLEENVYKENNILKKAVKEYFESSSSNVTDAVLIIPLTRKICEFIFNNFTGGKLMDLIQNKLKNHVKTFLKSLRNKNDSSKKEEKNTESKSTSDYIKNDKASFLISLTKKLGKNLITEHEFIGNIILIFLAGFETTANSITTAFYLLAKHPEMQKILRESVLKDGVKSEYLDMFWHENLRIFPPVTFFVSRKVVKDCEFDGVKFLKDDVVFIPTWLINRDPEIWPEPEKFDPMRFTSENKKTFHPCQFTTYGHGPKICLGLSFANYEAKSVIASVIKNFEIETCSKTIDPIKFKTSSVFNNPSESIILNFKKIV
nr:cytochrome p450 4727A3 [Polyphagotarsonemus latus]